LLKLIQKLSNGFSKILKPVPTVGEEESGVAFQTGSDMGVEFIGPMEKQVRLSILQS
jgi:hypothetical protein